METTNTSSIPVNPNLYGPRGQAHLKAADKSNPIGYGQADKGAQAASCVTTECHAAISAIKLPHAPVKEGDCASCHTTDVWSTP